MQPPGIPDELLRRLRELEIDPIYLIFYPPGFQHPKLLNPDHYVPASRQGLLMGVAALTAAVITIFAGLKLAARMFVLRKSGWEDVVVFLAWVIKPIMPQRCTLLTT